MSTVRLATPVSGSVVARTSKATRWFWRSLMSRTAVTTTAEPSAEMRREVASTQMNEPSRQRKRNFVVTRSDEERSERAISSTGASSGWTKSSSCLPTSSSASQPNTSLQADEQYRYRPAGLTTVIMSAEAVTRDA